MALQNYALQVAVQSLGFNVYSLHDRNASSYFLRIIKKCAKYVLALLGSKKYRKQLSGKNNAKFHGKKFDAFYKKYLTNIISISRSEALDPQNKSQWDKFSYAIVGSDMVWHNWDNTDENLDFYYLSFVLPEKRVCYAPSFGVRKFLKKRTKFHKKYLPTFKKLSCRESSCCEAIRKLTGLDAVHVVDPSLLLQAENYRVIAKKPDYDVPEHFTISYFIEDVEENRLDEFNGIIKKVGGNLKNIDIFNINDVEHFSTGADEFLWLMDHADYIFTNSFHGTVFSIMFKKPFIAFQRVVDGMQNKISDLLSTLGIAGRIYQNDGKIPEGKIDYDSVYEKLNIRREISLNYLKECLNVK